MVSSVLLLRVTKRKSSWEDAVGFDESFRTEFRAKDGSFDLNLSVYEIDDYDERVIQTYAEHAAGLGLNPPRGATNLDLSYPERPVVKTPGTSIFQFTKHAHRELPFIDKQELEGFARRLYDEVCIRSRKTTKQQLREYVRSRVAVNEDTEWIAHCNAHPKWGQLTR